MGSSLRGLVYAENAKWEGTAVEGAGRAVGSFVGCVGRVGGGVLSGGLFGFWSWMRDGAGWRGMRLGENERFGKAELTSEWSWRLV
jgi:hypothetical protein